MAKVQMNIVETIEEQVLTVSDRREQIAEHIKNKMNIKAGNFLFLYKSTLEAYVRIAPQDEGIDDFCIYTKKEMITYCVIQGFTPKDIKEIRYSMTFNIEM